MRVLFRGVVVFSYHFCFAGNNQSARQTGGRRQQTSDSNSRSVRIADGVHTRYDVCIARGSQPAAAAAGCESSAGVGEDKRLAEQFWWHR